jgi:Zn-dependent protease
MDGSVRIGRVFGIQVGVHHTWLIAFFLVAWSLAFGYFPSVYPSWAPVSYWLAGGLAAALLFGSVLVHELGHAVVAQARGLTVRSITLFIFGGVAVIDGEAEGPVDEFLVAIVGPITSGAIAGLAWMAGSLVPADEGMLPAILGYLAVANGILALFNLIPGFPLDGGRVLRAIVWGVSGSLETATNVSSYVGQVIAFGLIGVGVLRMFGGDFLGGLWTAFIGWFLNSAAESSRRQTIAQETFRGVRVADLMTPEPQDLPAETPIERFVYDEVVRRGHRALAVVDHDRLVGVVSITDAQRAPADQWPTRPVASVMTRDDLAIVAPGDELTGALKLLAHRGLHQLLVVDDGRFVGYLTRASIIQYLALRTRLNGPIRRVAEAIDGEHQVRRAA